ncbi:MAG: alpha/beta fold hydrolase [Myxococcales bacterium]|nr:alpha/beta fold hydrolase [Myxococcales bacterium]
MEEVARERIERVCSDGWRLSVELVVPASPRAVAIAGHAMMVDRRTLDARGDGLVSHLSGRGIAVVWPDLRGHGRSGPTAAEGGRWGYDDLVEQDTPALFGLARERFPGLPVTAVGHSLFGHVSLAHLARHQEAEVDALVLLAANVWSERWEPDRLVLLQKRLILETMGALTRSWGHFPARRLGLGSCDEAAGYVAQTVGFLRHGWRARDGFSYADALAGVRRPVLSVTGAGDRLICSPGCARRLASEIPGARAITVGRLSGLAVDPDHMGLVLDPRCRPAWDEVARFILAQAR